MAAYELNLVGLAEDRVEEMLRVYTGAMDGANADDYADSALLYDSAEKSLFRNAGGSWQRLAESQPGAGEFADPLLWTLTGELRQDGTLPAWANLQADSVLAVSDRMPQKNPAVVIGLIAQEYDPGEAPEAGSYQRAQASLGVWHVVKCRNTRTGGPRNIDDVSALAGATRYALQAWLPPGVRRSQGDPLKLRRGSLDRIEDGRAIWLDEYVFSWRPAGRRIQG